LPADLDAIDRRILKELQDDGRITNVELARRVGISAPPCLRRVRALEEAGISRVRPSRISRRLRTSSGARLMSVNAGCCPARSISF
jgi:DNA-binding Lrp family transcriptional regulator